MLLQLLSVLAGLASAAPAPANIYHGRLNQLAVEIPRLRDDVAVDGRLTEPAWAGAAILTGFSQYRPVDGLPATDSTEVLVWYDDHAIYFGIRAFEPHGVVNATLADRDRIGSDDFIQILLDTFSDRRRALLFAVNPLGVQSDGVYNEGAGDHLTDLSPDFIFDSRGHVTAAGFEVELRIPFKSIRYQSGRVQSWGINIVRGVQHSGHEQTWTPARRGETSFLAQAGTLLDLTDLQRGIVLDVNPVITAKADGRYAAPGDWSYDAGAPEFGGNLRWGATENLALSATINPDFSQVESDAGQAIYDPRQALFFPEKRPFFLEGSELFQAPSQLIYTRRIGSPLAAAKFTGKASGTSIGVISAVDDDVLSWTGEHRPVVNILRLSRDVGASSTAGLVYTDRIDGDWYNRVAAVDTRMVLGRSWSVSLQGGASFSRAPWGAASGAPVFQVNASRRGRAFNLGFNAGGSHPDFRADAGFVSRPGIVRANLRPTYTVYGAPGATIESWTGGITLDGTYRYRRFIDAGAPDDQKAHFSTALVLRGGWRLGAAFLLESFKYPPELYADYWIDLGSDTVPYVGTNRITNYDLQVNVGTPQFRTFRANAFVIAGRDENFEEWAPAWIVISTLNADWRPDEKVRVEGSWVQQRYHRTDDRSLVAFRQIPRLKLEYQLARPVFLRLVGEYDARMRDDLRDNSRTDRPILFCDAGPVDCTPARGFERGTFRGDFLFSYQPSPGTVLFAGYASTLAGDDGYGMRDLRRVNDGFFLKLSYLFRL